MKNELVEMLVQDFKDGEGKDHPNQAAAAAQLRAMLNGFEIEDLELLVSQIEEAV